MNSVHGGRLLKVNIKPTATCVKKTLQLGMLDVKSLQSHAKSEKHKVAVKGRLQTPAIDQYCRTSAVGALKSGPSTTHSTTPPVSDHQTAF